MTKADLVEQVADAVGGLVTKKVCGLAPGRVFHRCLFLALLFVPNKGASAQLPLISEPPEWSNSSKFSFIQTGGNTESTTFGFANELITEWEKTETRLEMSALRTRTTGFKRSAVRTVDGYQVEARTGPPSRSRTMSFPIRT